MIFSGLWNTSRAYRSKIKGDGISVYESQVEKELENFLDITDTGLQEEFEFLKEDLFGPKVIKIFQSKTK